MFCWCYGSVLVSYTRGGRCGFSETFRKNYSMVVSSWEDTSLLLSMTSLKAHQQMFHTSFNRGRLSTLLIFLTNLFSKQNCSNLSCLQIYNQQSSTTTTVTTTYRSNGQCSLRNIFLLEFPSTIVSSSHRFDYWLF